MPYTVKVSHDEAARRWFVHESDVPGLHAEAGTLDDLVAIIEDVAPELVGELTESADVPVCIQHFVVAKRACAA